MKSEVDSLKDMTELTAPSHGDINYITTNGKTKIALCFSLYTKIRVDKYSKLQQNNFMFVQQIMCLDRDPYLP